MKKVKIDFKLIKLLFTDCESFLIGGGNMILFSKRLYLSKVYTQLPKKHRKIIQDECPNLMEILHKTNMLTLKEVDR